MGKRKSQLESKSYHHYTDPKGGHKNCKSSDKHKEQQNDKHEDGKKDKVIKCGEGK